MRLIFALLTTFALLATACGSYQPGAIPQADEAIRRAQECVDRTPPGQVFDAEASARDNACRYKAAPGTAQPAATPRPAQTPSSPPAAPTSAPGYNPGFQTPVGWTTQPRSIQGYRKHLTMDNNGNVLINVGDSVSNVWNGVQLDLSKLPALDTSKFERYVFHGDLNNSGGCRVLETQTRPTGLGNGTFQAYIVGAPTEAGARDEVATIQKIAARGVSPAGDPAACPVVNGPTR